MTPSDPFGAFCTHAAVRLEGAPSGPLAGLTFAAKDNFDIAGFRTGTGSPDWLRTHPPAIRTAAAGQAVLDAGASLVAKANMDELAFSLDGMNFHYGTPTNPAAPDRIPGGSSSGPAVATAGKLVDLALGSDTAGSVRVPASLCGVFGIRPTHGRTSLEGIVPLAPSFDTVGWFARDASLLRRLGDILLRGPGAAGSFARCLIADELFQLADAEVRSGVDAVVPRIAEALGPIERVALTRAELQEAVEIFNTIRNREVREILGEWVEQTRPNFGPGIRQRFEKALATSAEASTAARQVRPRIQARLDAMLASGGVLCLPTVPVLPPLRSGSEQEVATYRARTLLFTGIATIGGLPEVTLPLARAHGCPVGVSLIAARGSDERLLALAETIAPRAS
jgi:amidase